MLLFHSSSDLNINYTLNSIDKIPQDTNETIVVVKYIAIKMNIIISCFFSQEKGES